MSEVTGTTWRVALGEIAERRQIRVGYAGTDTYEAYFEVSQIPDLVAVLQAVALLSPGPQIVYGESLQARMVSTGFRAEVVVEPRSDFFPVQIMRFDATTLADLSSVVWELSVELDVLEPSDWDETKRPIPATLGEDGKVLPGQLPGSFTGAVGSVNGMSGDVVLTAETVGALPANSKGTAGGVASLDSNGQLLPAQLPDIAVTDFLGSVGSQSAMLALLGEPGDWTVRTDIGTTWLLVGSTPSLLSSWQQLSYPAAPVTSVAGKSGAVTLVKADVSLGNVDNTSDANKPVSSAQQTALDLKLSASAAPELIQDTVGAMLLAGSGVTLSYNDTSGQLTISASGGGGGTGRFVYYTGSAWPARIAGTDPCIGISTKHAAAGAPSWLVDGDGWIAHPDDPGAS